MVNGSQTPGINHCIEQIEREYNAGFIVKYAQSRGEKNIGLVLQTTWEVYLSQSRLTFIPFTSRSVE